MNRFLMCALAAGAIVPVAHGTADALLFNQDVTSNAIFGSGNANGSFTVDRSSGVELGLRAKVRFPEAQNVFNSNGDGTYNHAAGNDAGRPLWAFEWSINSKYDGSSGYEIGDLTYEIGMDFDPTAGTSYFAFDHITPGAQPWWDHSFGDNSTGQGQGTEATDASSYTGLLFGSNLVQNSWRMDFFDSPVSPFSFDPNSDGTYSFYLKAFEEGGGGEFVPNLLAYTEIQVIVGDGVPEVPEPSSLAILGIGLLAAGTATWRNRRRGQGKAAA
jgi:hypothetical protein